MELKLRQPFDASRNLLKLGQFSRRGTTIAAPPPHTLGHLKNTPEHMDLVPEGADGVERLRMSLG